VEFAFEKMPVYDPRSWMPGFWTAPWGAHLKHWMDERRAVKAAASNNQQQRQKR
jgi:hypothetical protein